MDRERWQQIEGIFHAAWQIPPADRDRFLSARCSGDASLRQEVEALLTKASSGAFDAAMPPPRYGSDDKPTEAMLVAGAAVGPYQIEGPLGKGGMGEVYRARDSRLGRPVALKFLSGSVAANSSMLERFRREAQAISTLNHPNVCTVYDIGEQSGRPFLVMELMEGQTLKERIAERPISNDQLLSILIPILDALEAAHRAGIVHRDIKPANLFITKLNVVKVLDFGLAKSAGSEQLQQATPVDSLTATGTTVGTVAYMAPEQARGQTVDARSDLFSCGVVLYEMATGTLPFAGSGYASSIEALLTRTPRPARELKRDLLPEIERVIDRALEKDPHSRYQSAADMRAELLRARRVLDSLSTPVAPVPAPPRPLKTIATAAIAVVVIAAAAGWYFAGRNRPVTSPTEYVQLTEMSDSVSAPAISPDGRMVAFFRTGALFLNAGPIYLKVLPDGQATPLVTDPSEKYDLVFTPDGSRVAYTARDRQDGSWNTWTVPVTGGTPTQLMKNAAGLSFIGSGRVLFSEVMAGTALHMGVVTAEESRAGERSIYFPDHIRAMAHYSYLSPDGKSILIVEMDGTGSWLPCRLLPAKGKSIGRQVGPPGACISAGWSPDGEWMYFNGSLGASRVEDHVSGSMKLWRQKFPSGAAQQITFGPGEEEGLAIAPDGKSLISSVGVRKSSVWIHDNTGDRAVSPEGSASNARMSADGKRLFYLLRRNGSSVDELWSTDIASGKAAIALAGVSVVDYDISPDAQQVAFTSRTEKSDLIMVAPLDASSPPREVVRGGDSVSFGAPDELYFRELGAQVNYVARIKTDSSGRQRMLDLTILEKGAVSPGGAWVTIAGVAGLRETVVVSAKDRSMTKICVGLCSPKWSADGKLLYVGTKLDPSSSGRTLVLKIPPGQGLPPIPQGGIPVRQDDDIPGVQVIRQGRMVPGPTLEVYAFEKAEFVGNLFRIPLH